MIGLFRARLVLYDQSLLEFFERFEAQEERVVVTKYSYHWQDETGTLRRRWDNAAHYPQLATFPSHVHLGADDRVRPHDQPTLAQVLDHIRPVLEGGS